jgi:hypothetical protein
MGAVAVTVETMRIAIVVIGVLVALAGLLFALQGFGAVGGSPMSNTTTWSVLGPIIALAGIALVVIGWRGRRS